MFPLTAEETALVLDLHSIKAIQANQEKCFKLKKGLSNHYYMLRTPENKGGPLQRRHVLRIAQLLFERARDWKIDYDAICGLPKAGMPFAQAFAEIHFATFGRRVPSIKLSKLGDGDERRIGPIVDWDSAQPGYRTLILDDVVTEAVTKLEGIDQLLEHKLVVNDILVVVDRQQGGAEALANHGYFVHSIYESERVFKCLVDNKRITPETYRAVMGELRARALAA